MIRKSHILLFLIASQIFTGCDETTQRIRTQDGGFEVSEEKSSPDESTGFAMMAATYIGIALVLAAAGVPVVKN